MIVRFDSLNRYEIPSLTLCNPGSIYTNGAMTKAVGVLSGTSAEELVANFNAVSEFNLRITQSKYDNPEDDAHARYIFEAVQNRRLIFVSDIGYFIINDIQNGYDTDGISYKDIKAVSCESEIENKMLPYIPNQTYKFTDLLEQIVATLPLWTIDHIDTVIANKFRTFEDISDDTNCLSFMLENMQDAYECIFIFDIIHRTINVYDQDNYVRQTNIHLTKRDLIESISISENSSDVYTAISVFGDEDLSISAINPLGTSVIYDFTHYLDWMTDTLKSKVVSWQNDITNSKQDYYNFNLQYYKILDECSNLDNEIKMLNTQITMYQRCRDNMIAESSTALVDEYNDVIIANGGQEISILDNINDTVAQINQLITECESKKQNVSNTLGTKNSSLNSLKTQIDAIHQRLKLDTYFTPQESEELCNFIYEGSYKDEYITITETMTYEDKFAQMKTLYDRAEKRLLVVSRPTQEFNVDVENFIFDKNFAEWSEELETGCLINVELSENDIALLFLSNLTVNYDDGNMSLTFGNRFNKFDPKSLFDNILGNIDKSANSIDFIKEVLYPIKNEFSRMQEILQNSRNLTMNAALTSTNEEVIIDGSGYTGRKLLSDGTYDPHQVKLTGKSLVFTKDAWETCSVALGELIIDNQHTEYGINADVLMGKVLVGTNLTIEAVNSGNNVTTRIDSDGVTIQNGNIKIIDSRNGEIFGTDSSGNLYIKGNIFADSGKIGNLKLSNGKLFGTFEWASGSQWVSYISGINAVYENASNNTIFLYCGAYRVQDSNINKNWATNTFGAYNGAGAEECIKNTARFYVTHYGELHADGAIISGHIEATTGTIGGCNIVDGTLKISNANIDTLSASKISGGTLNANLITVTNLKADSITSGTLNASNVTITNLNASNITTGTLNAGRIPNISADKITTGTLSGCSIDIGSYFSVTQSGIAQLSNDTGYLTLGNSGNHPYVSALNVAKTENAISFRTGTSATSIGSQTAAIGITGDGYFKIKPGSRLYIDSHYGQTFQIRVQANTGKHAYLAFWKGLCVGFAGSAYNTDTYPDISGNYSN